MSLPEIRAVQGGVTIRVRVAVVKGAASRQKLVFVRGTDARSVRANLVPFCTS